VHCVKRWMKVMKIFWFLRPRLQTSVSKPYLRPTNISITSLKSKTAVRNGKMNRILLKYGIHLVTCIAYVSCIYSHYFHILIGKQKCKKKRRKKRRKKPMTLLGPQPTSILPFKNFFSETVDISSLTETCIINGIYFYTVHSPTNALFIKLGKV
jgi:hypothetical protein